MFRLKLRIFSSGRVLFNHQREFGNRSASNTEHYSSVIPVVSARDLLGNLSGYHEIIDVRTPSEHEEDNILNTATNLPVLTEQERVEVGTLYSKDKFKARKIGAALISRNIHKHIMEYFLDKDMSYRPLIYCWRGGQRSRSLAIVLQEIGFQPTLLAGGYKEYRRLVRAALCEERDQSWPRLKHFNFIKISGPTGSGKSAVLESLEERGEQVLHLEQLARHKGSVLGQYPGEQQPSQKMFETLIYHKLETQFSPSKVVWLENESSKIGSLIIPLKVWRKMGCSPRVELNVRLEDRVEFILSDYQYLCSTQARQALLDTLSRLERYAGRQRSSDWMELVRSDRYRDLVRDLILNYYDINYKKPALAPVEVFSLEEGILLDKPRLLQSKLINDLIYHHRMLPAREWLKSISISTHLTLGMLLRLILIAYGQHQDETMEVLYTDVDYKVFTDAARHVYDGGSPYERHTYRYSPLLAWLMVPNIVWSPNLGKLIFVLCDIFAGHLIYNILKSEGLSSEWTSRLSACMWLYNPLVMNVSTRGSAESVIVALVLLTIHLYQQKVFILTGMVYGLAIHMKIYPIIYCLTLYIPLTNSTGLRSLLEVNVARVRLVVSTVLTLSLLTWLFYNMYGEDFLQDAYLHHITRKDIRHNFSVYFYLLYLTVEYDDAGLNLVTFLPQLILLLVITAKFNRIHDVIFAMFCQTLIFVTFNKVVTAQYFLWYFSLLPLILPHLNFSTMDVLLGCLLWGFAQTSWLLPAYMLEFKGNNTFVFIWLEGLAFFSANVGILAKMIRRYREVSSVIEEQCNLQKLD